MKDLGIYVHVPFCLSKCRYCDFCSFPHSDEKMIERYVNSLFSEISEYKAVYSEYNVNTIYFGGGTPTLLNTNVLIDLLKHIKTCFNVSCNAEISIECNPATADTASLKALYYNGFNRLSIGVQSMNDDELKLLGRLHSSADAEKVFDDAREAGFQNVSVDVMYGIPSQTQTSLLKTLEHVCNMEPEHISLYGLKIEAGTYFAKHCSELDLPDEDEEYDMYMSAIALLTSNGYRKYEISNFAKEGRRSRHNLKYWQRKDYLGIGLAAHSCIGSRRFFNTYDVEKYLCGKRLDTEEFISEHDILCEKIMLGMRLSEGVDFGKLKKPAEKYRTGLEKFINGGYVKALNDTLFFTDDGMYVSNYILSEILDFEN